MKIKNILLILLALSLLMGFAACSSASDTTNNDKNEDDNTPFAPDIVALRDKMISDFDAQDAVVFESDILLDLYGIALDDVEESACYMTMDGVFPQEIVMIKAKNEDALERIEDCLENRIAEVKIQSENYDPENYALAQKCKVASKGLYVTMFLSPYFDEMTEIFNTGK